MFKSTRAVAVIAVIIMVIVCVGVCLQGCTPLTNYEETKITVEVIDKEPVAAKYEPPHYNAVTEYEYQWDWRNGDYKLLPVIKNEYVEEKFFVQYAITYTDGSIEYVWNDVPQAIYYEIMRELSPLNVIEPTT